jgi:RNA polymerase sigma-B factor
MPTIEERDRLVQKYFDLANSVARRFVGRGEEFDDLRQVALLALVNAADRFDPSRGLAFSTFAVPTIAGALKRHLRDRGWAVRPPRCLQERYLTVNAVSESLTGELKRLPTTAEIARRGGWSERDVIDAHAVQSSRYLKHWSSAEEDDRSQPTAIDANFERIESRVIINNLLSVLDDRERRIVKFALFPRESPSRYWSEGRTEPDARLACSPPEHRERSSEGPLDGRRVMRLHLAPGARRHFRAREGRRRLPRPTRSKGTTGKSSITIASERHGA